nr:uncharacterized protein LOC111753055 [Loxodonta africana]
MCVGGTEGLTPKDPDPDILADPLLQPPPKPMTPWDPAALRTDDLGQEGPKVEPQNPPPYHSPWAPSSRVQAEPKPDLLPMGFRSGEKLYPPLPTSPPTITPHPGSTASLIPGLGKIPSGPQTHSSPHEAPQAPTFLLRQVVDGESGTTRIHVPFSVADIVQRKEKFGIFSENPDKFREEFVKLSLTFDLTWKDVVVILTNCCTPDEKARILAKAREHADGLILAIPRHDILRVGGEAVPDQDLKWNYEDRIDQGRMRHFITCISERMKKCMSKPVNYNRIREVTQAKEENSAVFLNRLNEDFRKYTNTGPESAEGRPLVAMYFITQSSADIRRKLQKLQAGPQTPALWLVEEAFKVFNNWDTAEKAEKKDGMEGSIVSCHHLTPTSRQPLGSSTMIHIWTIKKTKPVAGPEPRR